MARDMPGPPVSSSPDEGRPDVEGQGPDLTGTGQISTLTLYIGTPPIRGRTDRWPRHVTRHGNSSITPSVCAAARRSAPPFLG